MRKVLAGGAAAIVLGLSAVACSSAAPAHPVKVTATENSTIYRCEAPANQPARCWSRAQGR